ncbi:MAG: LemA family protein, partial [Parcubacteria group bacterium]
MSVIILVLGVLAVFSFAMTVWGGYKRTYGLLQTVDEAWAQVQNAYQRRFDLIPNLVAAVDKFMERQQDTLQEV